MAQTVIEKIAQAHLADGPPARRIRAGDFVAIRPKHIMTHDNTAAVMKKFKAIGATRIHDPQQPVFAVDHDIQNRSPENLAKYGSIEAFAREHGIDFYPPGTGIGHQIMCEQGYVVPGSFVVASDSHSNMYGALGALGTPVVRTDAASIWATGDFWWQVPPTVQVVLVGTLEPGVTGKDVIITLCGLYNQGEVLNAAVEFSGPGVTSLSVDERLSISNMTTEWGALVGWFPCDEVTVEYLRRRQQAGIKRITDESLTSWQKEPPAPDADAGYVARIELDLGQVTPHVAGPDSVQVMQSVGDLEAERLPIHKAYLVSCVNSRLSDLEAAAAVLEGQKVSDDVEMYVAAASRTIQEEAEENGTWKTLLDAGARPLPPGCGPCIGLGTGLLEPGENGISATNRNFKGRMGSREARCYLASPAVVAASAVAGFVRAPGKVKKGVPLRRIETLSRPAEESEAVEILDGFPSSIKGRLVFVPQDNLNTDGIYPGTYTYREDMTPEKMAEVVMENYDPDFSPRVQSGDILIGGFNFGTGSSREQAATALQYKGIPLVVAGSFSQTYLRNAFNNGVPCAVCPDVVTRLKEVMASRISRGDKTIIVEEPVEVDFKTSRIHWRGESFAFAPLSQVPQSLVVAGGVENLVRVKLGIE